VLVEGAKVFGSTANRSPKNVYVLGIADRRRDGFVEINDFCVCGEKGNEFDDFVFGQGEALDKPRVVENPLNLLEHRAGKNQSVPAVEKLKQERSA